MFYLQMAFILLVLAGCGPEAVRPVAEKGRMDLSSWDFNGQGPLDLGGEWECYPGRLLAPSDFSQGRPPGEMRYLAISQGEGRRVSDRGGESAITCRLVVTVQNDPGPKVMMIRGPDAFLKIWVNGTLIADNKTAFWADHNHGPFSRCHLLTPQFRVGGGRLEVILQVAERAGTGGVLGVPVYLGAERDIRRMTYRRLLQVGVAGGVLFVVGLYHLALFAVRRAGPLNGYVGLYCLLWAFASLFGEAGACWMAALFEVFPSKTMLYLGLLPYALAPFLLVISYDAVCPKKNSPLFGLLFLVPAVVLSLTFIFAPEVRPALFFAHMTGWIACLYLFFRLAVDFLRWEGDFLFLVFAYLILFFFGINGILYRFVLPGQEFWGFLGALVFSLYSSILLSFRSAGGPRPVVEPDLAESGLSGLDTADETGGGTETQSAGIIEEPGDGELLNAPSRGDAPEEPAVSKPVRGVRGSGQVHRPSCGEEEKRALTVSVMNYSLDYWIAATGSSKVELAEKSGLWNVYIERDGFARTQTLDKYLMSDTLPKRPRLKQVVNTADFVLGICKGQSPLRTQLQDALARLRHVA